MRKLHRFARAEKRHEYFFLTKITVLSNDKICTVVLKSCERTYAHIIVKIHQIPHRKKQTLLKNLSIGFLFLDSGLS